MASKTTDLAIHAITTFSDQLRRTYKPDAQKLSELLSELRHAAQDERNEAMQVAEAANATIEATNRKLDMTREQVVRLRLEAEHLEAEVRKLKALENESRSRAAAGVHTRSSRHEREVTARSNDAVREGSSRTNEHSTKPTPPPTPTGPAATRVSNPHQDRNAEERRRDSAHDPRPQLPFKSTATTAAAATSSGASKDAARGYDSYMPSASAYARTTTPPAVAAPSAALARSTARATAAMALWSVIVVAGTIRGVRTGGAIRELGVRRRIARACMRISGMKGTKGGRGM